MRLWFIFIILWAVSIGVLVTFYFVSRKKSKAERNRILGVGIPVTSVFLFGLYFVVHHLLEERYVALINNFPQTSRGGSDFQRWTTGNWATCQKLMNLKGVEEGLQFKQAANTLPPAQVAGICRGAAFRK